MSGGEKEQIVGGGGASSPETLASFLRDLNIEPHDLGVYQLAFTHSSYNATLGTKHNDYQRLEFLGDALVGAVISNLIFFAHPEMQEGDMSVLKAHFVKRESEAAYAVKLGLHKMILVGKSYQTALNPAVLEDVFEAFVGALVVDQGMDWAARFLNDFFKEQVDRASIDEESNPKSALQEMMQAEYKHSVIYRIISEKGPAHDKTFVAAVYFDGVEIGRGEGKSKKEAESEAAKDALSKKSRIERV